MVSATPPPVRSRDLRDGLEAQHAASAKLSQPRQGILETIDGAQCVQFVDHEPKPLIPFRLVHGLEDPQAHPRRDRGSQGRDLSGAVG